MSGTPPPSATTPPYPTSALHPTSPRGPYVPMTYSGYNPGFKLPSHYPVFSPTGYPLNPVTTCDPEDFGPSPVPFQIPPSFQNYPAAPTDPASCPPPLGFIYQPHLLSYAPEPGPGYAPLENPHDEDKSEEDEDQEEQEENHILVPKSIRWVGACSSKCEIPGAFSVGHDQDGSPIYAGRANHNGDVLPAKVIPSKTVAYIAYGGEEIVKDQFEVMVQNTLQWLWYSNGNVPPSAVEIGETADGEILYLGRVNNDGALTPGKCFSSDDEFDNSHGPNYDNQAPNFGNSHGPNLGNQVPDFGNSHGPNLGNQDSDFGNSHGPNFGNQAPDFGNSHGPNFGNQDSDFGNSHGPNFGNQDSDFGNSHGPNFGNQDSDFGNSHGPDF